MRWPGGRASARWSCSTHGAKRGMREQGGWPMRGGPSSTTTQYYISLLSRRITLLWVSLALVVLCSRHAVAHNRAWWKSCNPISFLLNFHNPQFPDTSLPSLELRESNTESSGPDMLALPTQCIVVLYRACGSHPRASTAFSGKGLRACLWFPCTGEGGPLLGGDNGIEAGVGMRCVMAVRYPRAVFHTRLLSQLCSVGKSRIHPIPVFGSSPSIPEVSRLRHGTTRSQCPTNEVQAVSLLLHATGAQSHSRTAVCCRHGHAVAAKAGEGACITSSEGTESGSMTVLTGRQGALITPPGREVTSSQGRVHDAHPRPPREMPLHTASLHSTCIIARQWCREESRPGL